MVFIAALLAFALVMQFPGCETTGEAPRKAYPANWPDNDLLLPAGASSVTCVPIPGGETEITFLSPQATRVVLPMIKEKLVAARWVEHDLNEELEAQTNGLYLISGNNQSQVRIYGTALNPQNKAEARKPQTRYRYIFRKR